MEVEFRRTGERRYAVTVFRETYPTLEMNPAPGYDSLMPHDLMHFIVENEMGLSCGIYGQLADGGNAGTFRPVITAKTDQRELARLRKRVAKRGGKLLREGRAESELSEQAVYLCFNEWLKRSSDPAKRKLFEQTYSQLGQSSAEVPLNKFQLNKICDQLDRLSADWASLQIGDALTLIWKGKNPV